MPPRVSPHAPWKNKTLRNHFLQFKLDYLQAFYFLRPDEGADQNGAQASDQFEDPFVVLQDDPEVDSRTFTRRSAESPDRKSSAHSSGEPPAEIDPLINDACEMAIKAQKELVEVYKIVLFECQDGRPEKDAYIRWLNNHSKDLQKFHNRLEQYFSGKTRVNREVNIEVSEDAEGAASSRLDEAEQVVILRNYLKFYQQFLNLFRDIRVPTLDDFRTFNLAAGQLSLHLPRRPAGINLESRLSKFLGKFNAEGVGDCFEPGALFTRVSSFLQRLADAPMLSMLHEIPDKEERSYQETIRMFLKKAKDWYASERVPGTVGIYFSAYWQKGQVLDKLYQRVEELDELIRNDSDLHEEEKRYFDQSIQVEYKYNNSNRIRQAIMLLREYGPSVGQRILSDMKDIGVGLALLVTSPLWVPYKLLTSAEFRGQVGRGIGGFFRGVIEKIRAGCVNIVRFVKDPEYRRSINIREKLSNAWQSFTLYATQHPIRCTLYLLLTVGFAVGAHVAAPLVLAAAAPAVITTVRAAGHAASAIALQASTKPLAKYERRKALAEAKSDPSREARERYWSSQPGMDDFVLVPTPASEAGGDDDMSLPPVGSDLDNVELLTPGGSEFGASVAPQPAAAPTFYGMQFQRILANGHCLFNAVGVHLDENATELRNRVADYMDENFDEFKAFHDGTDEEFRRYIQAIRDTNAWGGEIEVRILQRLTGSPVIIIRSDANPTIPPNLDDYPGEPIFVYYNSSHYDAFALPAEANAREILERIQIDMARGERVTYNSHVPDEEASSDVEFVDDLNPTILSELVAEFKRDSAGDSADDFEEGARFELVELAANAALDADEAEAELDSSVAAGSSGHDRRLGRIHRWLSGVAFHGRRAQRGGEYEEDTEALFGKSVNPS
ncbi:MAG: hypothetical protein CMF39_00175 [Legionellaceae bacterium]|nr:hypothetical protein [Legionellaceae bacterium]|tara:strand:- start:27 stop:2714 length:2688 start_codon:yes stop_codon:yes gene_type:complete